jgi:hypothetical protein
MTIRELRKLIRGLPPDMKVMLPINGEALISVCEKESGVEVIEVNGEPQDVMVLEPCMCHPEQLLVGQKNIAESYLNDETNLQ